MSALPPPVPRIVKPRKPASPSFHLIAATRTAILLERTGEQYPISELPSVIVAERSAVIVAPTWGRHLLNLNAAFAGSALFQFKLSPVYREANAVNGERSRKLTIRDTIISLVGFPGNFHHPLDPITFVRMGIDDIRPGPEPMLVKLLEWGKELRSFCIANDLRPKPTSGGLAAQLLRDRRFYPRPRRKAPRLLNRKVRPRQPGNYYRLFAREGSIYTAAYLDMRNAHHFIASELDFPCANSLHAYGFHHQDIDRVWARQGTDRYRKALELPGILHVRLSVPRVHPSRFPLPFMETPGQKRVWIYSNEVPMICEHGGSIDGIISAIVSEGVDTGLQDYASWSIAELERRSEQKAWLKPVLHAAYGLLAVNARELEFGFRIAKEGKEEQYPVGPGVVPVKVFRSGRLIEPPIANVIQRGILEAETRLRALRLAQWLTSYGGDVLCIYADSLFVKIDRMPLLPPPWRLKEHCSGLVFHNSTHFSSPEITRLPGISRKLRNRPEGPAFRRGSLIR